MNPPEVRHVNRREHTARVPHLCAACRSPIQPGQRYARFIPGVGS
jgi:hypothetical protein